MSVDFHQIICALILWRSCLQLLVGKFCQCLTELSAHIVIVAGIIVSRFIVCVYCSQGSFPLESINIFSVPTQKMIRYLTSSPSVVKKMLRKAELMGIITQVNDTSHSSMLYAKSTPMMQPYLIIMRAWEICNLAVSSCCFQGWGMGRGHCCALSICQVLALLIDMSSFLCVEWNTVFLYSVQCYYNPYSYLWEVPIHWDPQNWWAAWYLCSKATNNLK